MAEFRLVQKTIKRQKFVVKNLRKERIIFVSLELMGAARRVIVMEITVSELQDKAL